MHHQNKSHTTNTKASVNDTEEDIVIKHAWRALASSNLFLLEDYQFFFKLKPSATITWTVIGITGKHSPCWTISWYKNNVVPKIVTECLHAMLMKYKISIKESLINARKYFYDAYHNAKQEQRVKYYWYRCLLQWTIQIIETVCTYQIGRLQIWYKIVHN